jgi:hypothetical protein
MVSTTIEDGHAISLDLDLDLDLALLLANILALRKGVHTPTIWFTVESLAGHVNAVDSAR